MGLHNDIPQYFTGLVRNAQSISIGLRSIDQRHMKLGVYLIASKKACAPFSHFHNAGISNTKRHVFSYSLPPLSPPAYLRPQACSAWTAKSSINFPERGPPTVDSSNGIVEDKIKPEIDPGISASTLASPAERGGPSAKASNETAPKANERPEASGQAIGANSASDQNTTTAGGAKEIIEVDAAESLKLEPLAETVTPATEDEDGTIKIRKKSKGGVVATPETMAAEKVWKWGICKGHEARCTEAITIPSFRPRSPTASSPLLGGIAVLWFPVYMT